MSSIAFPLYPSVTLLDFAGATQIFAMAGFRVYWVSNNREPVQTTEGISVQPNATFSEDSPEDLRILFVPGGSAAHAAMVNEPLVEYIRSTAAKVEWNGAVCTGTFLLAAAGLLQDVCVTTHWAQLDNLKMMEKKFELHIPDGFPRGVFNDAQKIFTGGGVSSSMDLALELLIKMGMKPAAERSQLINQYAPSPPIHSGDPFTASAELVAQVSGGAFVTNMRKAVEQLIAT